MDYGEKSLSTVLREHNLSHKSGADGLKLIQEGRVVGVLPTASVGWCLIRLLDNQPIDHYPRSEVREARRLIAGLRR